MLLSNLLQHYSAHSVSFFSSQIEIRTSLANVCTHWTFSIEFGFMIFATEYLEGALRLFLNLFFTTLDKPLFPQHPFNLHVI